MYTGEIDPLVSRHAGCLICQNTVYRSWVSGCFDVPLDAFLTLSAGYGFVIQAVLNATNPYEM